MFSSARCPCQLHEEGRVVPLQCQVTALPKRSNIKCRQCQHQLLGADPELWDKFQSSWLAQPEIPFRQSFFLGTESSETLISGFSWLSG